MMLSRVSLLVLMGGCSLLARGDAPAQDPSQSRLALIRSLRCVFSAAASGTWEGGTVAVRARTGVTLRVEIQAIDTRDGAAVLSGVPEAASFLVAQLSGWTLHFVQTSATGGLSVTSVFARESRDGRLKAMHSRSSFVPAGAQDTLTEPDAQQYYGDCEATYGP
jgi:hypothetical protein